MGGTSFPCIKMITFSIAADGTITKSALDTHISGGRYDSYPRLLNISGSVWALAYCGSYADSYGIQVSTLTINPSTGDMSTSIDSLFVDSGKSHSYLRWMSGVGDYKLLMSGYVVVYAHGQADSINIDRSGNIAAAVTSTLQFYTHGTGYGIEVYPDIVEVTSGVWAVYFNSATPGGKVYTIGMNTSGVVSLLDNVDNSGYSVARLDDVIKLPYSDYYICSHSYGATSPYYTTLEVRHISDAGVVSSTIHDAWKISTEIGAKTSILHVSGHIYLVVCGTMAETVYIESILLPEMSDYARVSSLIHRWSPGTYTLEMQLGGFDSSYKLPITLRNPASALAPSDEYLEWVKQHAGGEYIGDII